MVAKEEMHHSLTKERCSTLIAQANPELYRKNAFRILGLPIDASARQINRQVQQMQMLARAGSSSPEQAARISPPLPGLDGDPLHDAVQRLRDPELRLLDEFFWFWPLPTDGCGALLSALEDEDCHRAASVIREHETRGNGDPMSWHNLAVLAHALALKIEHEGLTRTLTEDQRSQKEFYWRYAYAKWKLCLDHEGFWKQFRQRVRQFDDPRITTGLVRRFRATLPLALLSINARFSTLAAEKGNADEADWHLQLMKNAGLEAAFVNEAVRLASASILEEIKLHCKSARTDAELDPNCAEGISRQLISQTERLVAVLKTILDTGHPDREAACDDVALTILECQINFVLKTNNLPVTLELLERAHSIAESGSTRQRIQENIQVIRDNLECNPCWFCEEYLATGGSDLRLKRNKSPVCVHRSKSMMNPSPGAFTEVPRCARCKSVHMQTRALVAAGSVLGGLVSIAVYAAIPAASADPTGQVLGILAAGLAIGIGSRAGYAAGRFFAPDGVKPESAKKQYSASLTSVHERWGVSHKPVHVR